MAQNLSGFKNPQTCWGMILLHQLAADLLPANEPDAVVAQQLLTGIAGEEIEVCLPLRSSVVGVFYRYHLHFNVIAGGVHDEEVNTRLQ